MTYTYYLYFICNIYPYIILERFAVMENMREFLSSHDPSKPHHFGFRLKRNGIPNGLVVGGPGYILSKEAVRRIGFALQSSSNNESSSICKPGHKGNEDEYLSKSPNG